MKRFLLLSCMALAGAAAFSASPWLAKVYEYSPAPGQFVNLLPEYEAGDNAEAMAAKAAEYVCGQRYGSPVTLGAWGGYIIVGFDHPVVNVAGQPDFKIYGNAFIGSAEPGVVMVSRDANGNGIPDDPWYELRGSEAGSNSTYTGYSIRYTRPDAAHTPTTVPGDDSILDSRYIGWTDSREESGYLMKLTYHTQDYWPMWSDATQLGFTGTRLPNNAVPENGVTVMKSFDWGYADNLPNADTDGLDISNAIDAAGNPVHLDAIDFIRIHTGVNAFDRSIGETSTEVSGGEDLHPGAQAGIDEAVADNGVRLVFTGTSVAIDTEADVTYEIYTASGLRAASGVAPAGSSAIDLAELCRGVYIIRAGGHTLSIRR